MKIIQKIKTYNILYSEKKIQLGNFYTWCCQLVLLVSTINILGSGDRKTSVAPIVTSRIEREIKEVLLGAVHKLCPLKIGTFWPPSHPPHSGCLDSKNILSTIDAPPEVPGVSKNHILFFKNETVFLLR